MPFVEKEIDFGEFMKQLHQRIQRGGNAGALTFFKCFLQKQLPREVKRRAVRGWDGRTVSARDFDVLYPMAAKILLDAATMNATEASYAATYEEASAVSQAFCDQLNETFQCSGDDEFKFIPIKPYSQMMAESELVEIARGPDGRMVVSLTAEGTKAAREFEQEIGGAAARN